MTSVTVVGAGVFGASTARELALRGYDVTLVEQYVPGTVRSGSGGDTRLLARSARRRRVVHAPRPSARARSGSSSQEETATRIWEPVGVAWFAQRDDGFEAAEPRRRSKRPASRANGCRRTRRAGSTRRSASTTCSGVLYEPDAGVLHARRATQLLVDDGDRHGVRLRDAAARRPADEPRDRRRRLGLRRVAAEALPGAGRAADLAPRRLLLRRRRARGSGTPGFCDYDAPFYGHGEIGGLGVKVAPDGPGDEIDPDRLDRLPLPDARAATRARTRRGASRRSPTRRSSARASASTSSPATRTSSFAPAPGARRRGGCSAAARGTASSTARRSASTSPTASKAAASRSRSTRSARAPATPGCAPRRLRG